MTLHQHTCIPDFMFIFFITKSRSARLHNSKNAKGRLPELTAWYEGVQTPDLFVLGAASHSRDYRTSAGGFIHGFRYTGKSSVLSVCLKLRLETHDMIITTTWLQLKLQLSSYLSFRVRV